MTQETPAHPPKPNFLKQVVSEAGIMAGNTQKYARDLFERPSLRKMARMNTGVILGLTLVSAAVGSVPLVVLGLGALAITNTALMDQIIQNETRRTVEAKIGIIDKQREARRLNAQATSGHDFSAMRADASHDRPTISPSPDREAEIPETPRTRKPTGAVLGT